MLEWIAVFIITLINLSVALFILVALLILRKNQKSKTDWAKAIGHLDSISEDEHGIKAEGVLYEEPETGSHFFQIRTRFRIPESEILRTKDEYYIQDKYIEPWLNAWRKELDVTDIIVTSHGKLPGEHVFKVDVEAKAWPKEK